MKYLVLIVIFFENIICPMPRRSHLTPAEKKYQNSLRKYDPSNDVRLNGQRLSKGLYALTKENLKKHSALLRQDKKGFLIPQNLSPKNLSPIPPIDTSKLNTLRRSRKINYDGHD